MALRMHGTLPHPTQYSASVDGAIGAFLWGALGASSLLVGAVLALRTRPSNRTVGLVLAFGAGSLISAVAYELVPTETEQPLGIGLAIGLGALTFYFGDTIIERMGGGQRKRLDPDAAAAASAPGSGPAIALGTVLDGIPESLVLGIGLALGGAISVAFLAAVFISNLPEGIGASVSLRAAGMPSRWIYGMWAAIVVASATSAAVGFALASRIGAGGELVQAFAAGALITMIADTMIPEAFEHGGKVTGLATVMGFALAALISGLE
jgi:ZIP family zinc transporter